MNKIEKKLKENPFALTVALCDGQIVILDVNSRPVLNNKGIVSQNKRGEWNIMCGDTLNLIENGATTAGQICSLLGFSGYSFFNLTKVESVSIDTRKLAKRHPQNENEVDCEYERVGNAQECTALYVECEPHSNSNKPNDEDPKTFGNKPEKPIIPNIFHHHPIKPIIQPHKKPSVVTTNKNKTEIPLKPSITPDHHWPWSVDIYVDGKLICIGVLLDGSCVVTEKSCMALVNLEFDYVTVVVGKSQAFMNIIGPYEQIVRVSCFVNMDGGNTVLLFLEENVRFNRECLPTFLPER